MLEVQQTVNDMARADSAIFDEVPEVLQVAITPDFHKARGIPVGTVMATTVAELTPLMTIKG